MTQPAGITPADIESKFRDVQGQVDVVAQDGKKSAAVAGTAIAVLILLIAYVLGRRAGKRKSSVLEIRRL
jgi:hypothetical protein